MSSHSPGGPSFSPSSSRFSEPGRPQFTSGTQYSVCQPGTQNPVVRTAQAPPQPTPKSWKPGFVGLDRDSSNLSQNSPYYPSDALGSPGQEPFQPDDRDEPLAVFGGLFGRQYKRLSDDTLPGAKPSGYGGGAGFGSQSAPRGRGSPAAAPAAPQRPAPGQYVPRGLTQSQNQSVQLRITTSIRDSDSNISTATGTTIVRPESLHPYLTRPRLVEGNSNLIEPFKSPLLLSEKYLCISFF